MNKDTPQARFVRTFLTLIAAVAVTAAAVDWTTDLKGSATQVAVGVIAALLGATIAALQVMAGVTATTPLGKALVSFAQLVGPGLATIVVADLTGATLLNLGQQVVRFLVAGVLAAIGAYALNRAEDGAPTPA